MKRLSTAILLVMTVITSFALYGCSSSPSNSDIEGQLKNHFKSELFDVVSVKINDKRAVKDNKSAYEVNYDCNVKFKMNYSDLQKEFSSRSPLSAGYLERAMELKNIRNVLGEFKSGEEKKITRSAVFEKWDKGGWKLVE